MKYHEEFQTVDLILQSKFETRATDAFALSLIKAERQIRKLFTFIVFQFPSFTPADVHELIQILSQNRQVYFEGFLSGIDEISRTPIRELIGVEYPILLCQIQESMKIRNKIFHGQLTGMSISRTDLEAKIVLIRKWCNSLAIGAQREFGYDGFRRNSFRKSLRPVWQGYKVNLNGIEEYRTFIRQVMER